MCYAMEGILSDLREVIPALLGFYSLKLTEML